MIRWKISTDNRVGMVHDVLRVFAAEEINIIAMEVIPKKIHLKLKDTSDSIKKKLHKKLSEIPGLRAVQSVEIMPQEEKEQQLRTVLNSISEGIIAINGAGVITTLNPAAENLFHRQSKEILGEPVQKILGEGIPIITCLQDGKRYDNQEMIINTSKGRSHYLSSGRPLCDDRGNIIGAVAVMKDIAQVRQLIYKMTRPSMITFAEILYQSEKMEQVIKLAKKTATSNSTILIRGESGTGKELFARAIHASSDRADQPFIPINCGALPDSLLESELFGYEEGTFTGGSKGGKQGLFEMAHNGTLFLDEIGELPTQLQVKLLRVLQEGKVRRIGGSNEQPIDVRIIAATNKDLEKMLENREFRKDLYYRLNVIPIHIPPLRERKEDILFLVKHYLELFSNECKKEAIRIGPEAIQNLLEYDWPGNVRELRNSIERAVHLANDNLICWNDLFPNRSGSIVKTLPIDISINQITSLDYAVSCIERLLLEKVLDEYNGSRQMGEVLGVSHTTVLNKMKKYDLL